MMKRLISIMMTVAVLLAAIPVNPIFAADKDNTSVYVIKSVEDFAAFSKKCNADAWSMNKYVKLNVDLDLTGMDFEPIQVFAGTFDGGGHTISGIDYVGSGYAEGFFRFITADGEVKNLTVTGTIKSENKEECTGGICGINAGRIVRCTFRGIVEGKSEIGGIAGENESSGIISYCNTYGSITGYDGIGGIAGKNFGMIISSCNRAGINSDNSWLVEADEEGFKWMFEDDSNSKLVSGTDIGGIAGVSKGIIVSCTNYGVVGYEHNGYNIGGIVGRQSGQVMRCSNQGNVYGRKDVGGIAGQMEPYISVDEMDSLSDSMQLLHDMVDKLLDDLDVTQTTLNNDFDSLRIHSGAALDHTRYIADSLVDSIDSNVDSVNDVMDRIEYVVEEAPEVIKNISAAFERVDDVTKDLAKVNEDLDIIDKLQKNDYSETAHNRLSAVTGVGGKVSFDIANPETGVIVSVKVKSDDGYVLKSIAAADEDKKPVELSQVSWEEYTFVMPEKNVSVNAEFAYCGRYIPQSGPGGIVTVAEKNGKVTLRVKPDGGYMFDRVFVGADSVGKELFGEENGVFTYTFDRVQTTGPVIVSVQFYEVNGTNPVKLVSTTGGSISADADMAGEGNQVTITVHENTGYRLESLSMNGDSILDNAVAANEYYFDMPKIQADVEAVFSFIPDEDTVIYADSSLGGTVMTTKNITSNDYVIRMTAAPGYRAAEEALMIRQAGGQEQIVLLENMEKRGEGYFYTININNYIQPVSVYGSFEKVSGSMNIQTVNSTGGVTAAGKAEALKGEKISITAVPAASYNLQELNIINKATGEKIEYTSKPAEHLYEFVMPDSDVQIYAIYAPVLVIVESNAGGTAELIVSQNKATLNIWPNPGYVLAEHPSVTDATGAKVLISKKSAGTQNYEFEYEGYAAPLLAKITFMAATEYQTYQEAKDRIKVNSKAFENSMNQVSDTAKSIEELFLDESGERISLEDFLKDSQRCDQLIDRLLELSEELSAAGEATAALINDLNIISSLLSPYLEESMQSANDDIDKTIKDLEKVSMFLQIAAEEADNIIDYLNDLPDVEFSKLGDEFGDTVNSLLDELDAIKACSDILGDDMEHYSDVILDDLRAVNDQVNNVFQLLVEKISNVEDLYLEDNVYEDISDEDIEAATAGKVEDCVNSGSVKGNVNVGGIAGSMAIDEEDPEDNAAGAVEILLGNRYMTQCIISQCENRGVIQAKKDGVGGVVGFMRLGIVTDCRAYGSAESTEGEYIGGVCGQSLALIRNCWILTSLSGSQYVGGVAGYGTKIQNCKVMSLIDNASIRKGAIAGWVETEENERIGYNDNISNNYFVSSTLNGIDHVSYVDVAEPITYSKLLTMENLPREYRHLHITFMTEDAVVAATEVEYGQKVSDIEYPDVPAKEGCYGRWEDIPGDVIEGNITVMAEYFDNITTLKSEDGRLFDNEQDKNGSGRAYAMLDGLYTDNARLSVVRTEEMINEDNKTYMAVVYEVTVENADIADDAISKLRILNPFAAVGDVSVNHNGVWESVDYKEYGHYLQVVMTGGNIQIRIMEDKSTDWIIIAAAAGITVLLAAVFIMILKRGKKKKKQNQ